MTTPPRCREKVIVYYYYYKYFCFFAPNTHCALGVALSGKKQVPFSMDCMAIGNVELMNEFSQTFANGNSKNEIR